MGDTVLGEKTVSVEPGLGAREVDFEVAFNTLSELPEPDRPLFVPLRASITTDRLIEDDERFLAAPVVAALPVVFVDQYGADGEDPIRNRIGETRPLRRLLAPKTTRSDAPRQLVKVIHITPDELTQDVLSEARLVVIAGIQDPGDSIPLLREYVSQGGQLVIAAGGNFDPDAWNAAGYAGGEGVLPLPLAKDPLGEVPEVAGNNLQVYRLAFESLSGEDYFQLASVPEAELRDLYSEPFFFKAVDADASSETLAAWRTAEAQRLEKDLTQIAEITQRRQELTAAEAQGQISETQRQQLRDDEAALRRLRPQWLTWAASSEMLSAADEPLPRDPADRRRQLDTLVQTQSPRVLARFDTDRQPPYLVSRRVGRGEVVFCTSGLASSWSTLPTTNAVVVFDRILRGLTRATLPQRNFPAQERLTLPLPSDEPNLSVTLLRPGQKADEPLDVGYIGASSESGAQRGVTIGGLLDRGVYRVAGYRTAMSADPAIAAAAEKPVWEVPLAVGGDPLESDLTPLAREQFDEIAANAHLRWVGPGEDISLAGVAIRGQSSWWWLIVLTLVVLLVEMALLAWPAVRPQEAIA
jgi:hypothetical protein